MVNISGIQVATYRGKSCRDNDRSASFVWDFTYRCYILFYEKWKKHYGSFLILHILCFLLTLNVF